MFRYIRSSFCFSIMSLFLGLLLFCFGVAACATQARTHFVFSNPLEVAGFYAPLFAGVACLFVGALIIKKKPSVVHIGWRACFTFGLCCAASLPFVFSSQMALYFVFTLPLFAIFFSGIVSSIVVSISIGYCALFMYPPTPDMFTYRALLALSMTLVPILFSIVLYLGSRHGGWRRIFAWFLPAYIPAALINAALRSAAAKIVYPSAPFSLYLSADCLISFAMLIIVCSIFAFALRTKASAE